MNSFGWHTVVATPPMVIQGFSTVCPPFTLVPASSAVSWDKKEKSVGHLWVSNDSITSIFVYAWTGIILFMGPANERRRYIVTLSLIGWVHTTAFSQKFIKSHFIHKIRQKDWMPDAG